MARNFQPISQTTLVLDFRTLLWPDTDYLDKCSDYAAGLFFPLAAYIRPHRGFHRYTYINTFGNKVL